MTASANMDNILSAIPGLVPGPGGVVSVLKDGEVVGQRAWGYADLDNRIPMTPQTQIPICSISKQMVCLVMRSLIKDPNPAMLKRGTDPRKQFDEELRKLVPNLFKHEDGSGLTVDHLCHMQSGIRDYWAMTTLWGARPDGEFSLLHDAPQSLERCTSFHFTPGTQYSYSNVNFHVLGRILEAVSGCSLAQLLAERLFVPAGMSTAALCPNTAGLPLPIAGYEGNANVGYFKSSNRIEWAGDAGIAASLEDMVAYEKYVDRSWQDPESLYSHNGAQQTFRDGANAAYGFGLGRSEVAGKTTIRHGGALRGFRHERLQVPSERISVVVMLNYEASVSAASEYVVKQMLGWQEPESSIPEPAPEWLGDFLDADTQLRVTIEKGQKAGTLAITYSQKGEVIKLSSEKEAESPTSKWRIDGDTVHATRKTDNSVLRAERITKSAALESQNNKSSDYIATYACPDMQTTFHCSGGNGALYGSFDGFLGKGPIWMMRQLGGDVWVLGNPRGMDSTPPGDWTVVFKRGKDGKVEGCTLGCWLARKVEFSRSADA